MLGVAQYTSRAAQLYRQLLEREVAKGIAAAKQSEEVEAQAAQQIALTPAIAEEVSTCSCLYPLILWRDGTLLQSLKRPLAGASTRLHVLLSPRFPSLACTHQYLCQPIPDLVASCAPQPSPAQMTEVTVVLAWLKPTCCIGQAILSQAPHDPDACILGLPALHDMLSSASRWLPL